MRVLTRKQHKIYHNCKNFLHYIYFHLKMLHMCFPQLLFSSWLSITSAYGFLLDSNIVTFTNTARLIKYQWSSTFIFTVFCSWFLLSTCFGAAFVSLWSFLILYWNVLPKQCNLYGSWGEICYIKLPQKIRGWQYIWMSLLDVIYIHFNFLCHF